MDLIKNILDNDHIDCYYEEHQLATIFSNIIQKVNNPGLKREDIIQYVSKSTQFSKKHNKYYFNTKRNQVKLKDNIASILLKNDTQKVLLNDKSKIEPIVEKKVLSKISPKV